MGMSMIDVFKLGVLQDFSTLLKLFIDKGIVDATEIRNVVRNNVASRKAEAFMSDESKEKALKAKQAANERAKEMGLSDDDRKNIYQGHILCPECRKANLTIKKLEGVTYTACPSCYKSVEFK